MPRCVRTSRADEDLIEIWLSISDDNPKAADRLIEHMEAAFSLLAEFPWLGPARADLAPDLRYFVVRKYLILYRQIADDVEIVRVLHGARYIPDLL